MSTGSREDLLRPILHTSKKWYLMVAITLLGGGIFAAAYGYQLYHGLIVTNLSDWGSGGGVTWGMYIGAFIWWVGIAHGGIILSAAVRLLGMERYQPVARMAELTTLGALMMAGLYIVVHVGRPDRIVTSVLLHYHHTIHSSPLVWDVTVITLYFVLTATYLGLTLRYDVARMYDQLPDKLNPLYDVMTLGYSESEDPIIERMVWWVALGIIILAPLLLHGGVIPWLFALLPGEPRWAGAHQGPVFLMIALMSAISGIMILSYAFRKAYDWQHILTDDVFRGLTLWLGFFTLLFLWLQLQQVITGVFAAPEALNHAISHMLETPVYLAAVGLILGVLMYIFATAVRPSIFSIRRSLAASFVVLGATLTEKTLFVVEGLQFPVFNMYEAVPGPYFPSPIELASLLGTASLAVLFFLVVAKLFPVVELHAIESADHHAEHATDGGQEVEE